MTPERERVRKPISGWNLKQAGWVEKEAEMRACEEIRGRVREMLPKRQRNYWNKGTSD